MPRTEKLDIAADIVMKGMRADYVHISVKSPDNGKLGLLVSACTESIADSKDGLDKAAGLAGYVADTIKPSTVRDLNTEDRFVIGSALRDAGLTSALAVPMILNGNIVGILCVYMKARTNFPSFVIKLLNSFANLIALDIENESLTERVGSLEKIIKGVCESVGERVTVQDKNHKILYANEAAAESVGLPVSDIIGQQCCWIFHNSKEPAQGCPVEEALRTGERVVKVMNVEGIKVRIIVELIKDGNGEVDAVVEHVSPA
jgi:GAF domain-containing protein